MYSQYGEDDIILQVLATMDLPKPPRLLEIGAWSPIHLSNSRAFIEAGWMATLVEFSPSAVRELVKEYGRNERVEIVQAAITPLKGEHSAMRFEITDDALSSSNAQSIETWKDAGGFYGSMYVAQMPLAELLMQFGSNRGYEYISIDTEGTSVELALELLESDFRPRVLCVEHDQRLVWLMEHAQKHNYRMQWANGTNAILVR